MALGLIAAGIGAVGSIAQAVSGFSQSRRARQELENFQRQELTSTTDDLQVYTKGGEMQTQESARFGASALDALSRGGLRGVVGGVGALTQQQDLAQRRIAASYEDQQARIDQMRVRDAMRIQQMQEQREMQDIAALSSQYQAGQQMLWSGIGGLAQAGISGVQMYEENKLNQAYIDSISGGGIPPNKDLSEIFKVPDNAFETGQAERNTGLPG